MSVRRVVTGVVDGKSQIISDGTVPAQPHWEDLWVSDPNRPLGYEPSSSDVDLQGQPGVSHWRVFAVPTDEEMKRMYEQYSNAGGGDAVDSSGFHQTDTLDLIFVLDGDITLEMEEGEVLLHPGDCVVQSATNHAWRNRNDRPVKLLGVMTTLPG